MLSLYAGRIDGIFGPKTLDALLQFLEENYLDLETYIACLKTRKLAIAPAVFEEIGAKEPEPQTINEHQEFIFKEIENILIKDEKSRAEKERGPVSGFFDHIWEKTKTFFVKLYKGTKSVAVYVGKTLAKGAKFIWKSIKSLKDGLAVHFMSQIFLRIKKGISLFWHSLSEFYKFLKLRIVATQNEKDIMATCFLTDFDVVNYCADPNKFRQDVNLNSHLEKLAIQAKIFYACCDIIGAGISIAANIIGSITIGWLRFAVYLAENIIKTRERYNLRFPILQPES